jgi:hypothetical protein
MSYSDLKAVFFNGTLKKPGARFDFENPEYR